MRPESKILLVIAEPPIGGDVLILIYTNLLSKFKELTGCPILVNTSFNIRGEPIVCDVEDAYSCFMGTNLDILVCENFLLYKKDQKQLQVDDYKNKFELD